MSTYVILIVTWYDGESVSIRFLYFDFLFVIFPFFPVYTSLNLNGYK